MPPFKALLITRDEATRVQAVAEAMLTDADLMEGDVDIRVEYSTVNYKDGLAITGKLPVVRRFPMVPGVDLAGTVAASRNPAWREGDKVIVNGHGLGEAHLGAFAEMARLKAEWLTALPAGFSTLEAMAVGTAGYTAMMAAIALERHGVVPESGPIVVTGAAGGLGSMAVALLSRLGYGVAAVTGRAHEHDFLRSLGASEILDRAEFSGAPKLLGKERFAGGIDAAGGTILANVLSMTSRNGAVAACGNAGGMELSTSVAPFILRGVALLGIDSVYASKERRAEAWSRLARDLDRDKLAAITTVLPFSGIRNAAHDIVEGKVRGRLVVEIGG
jgi:acrylyl-CoA reductase (NADPH)